MLRSKTRRNDRQSNLPLRVRRKSFPAKPLDMPTSDEMICDVSDQSKLILRVCLERGSAVLTNVRAYRPRGPQFYEPTLTDPSRIKKLSIQHTIRDLQNIVFGESCTIVIDAPMPKEMTWEEALSYRNNLGRRVREKLDRRKLGRPTFVAVITTQFAQPYGLRIFCRDSFDEAADILLESVNCEVPDVRILHDDEIRAEIFSLNNDLALVPKRKKRYFVSRGSRLKVDTFEVSSVEHGRALLQEIVGEGFAVIVRGLQLFSQRQRAEFVIKPITERGDGGVGSSSS